MGAKLGHSHWQRLFENRVLRKIFVPKRDKVSGTGKKLHSEDLHDLQSSPNIIRIIKSRTLRWAGKRTRKEEMRGAYRGLGGKHEAKRPLGRHKPRWEDDIKVDL